jgi:hypothetical protein
MALVEVNWKPDNRQLRLFGLAGTVVYYLLAGTWTVRMTVHVADGKLGGASGSQVNLIYAVWAAICIWTLLAIFRPKYLLPFYLAITAVTLPIGIVVSFAILAVLYFGVFTPISLVFRLFGRDALHRRFDASAKTYWMPRRPVDDVRRYYRQF